MVGLPPKERERLRLPRPQGDALNCGTRKLGGDEKRELVAAANMSTGICAALVEMALDYLYSKAVRGDASPVLGPARVDI